MAGRLQDGEAESKRNAADRPTLAILHTSLLIFVIAGQPSVPSKARRSSTHVGHLSCGLHTASFLTARHGEWQAELSCSQRCNTTRIQKVRRYMVWGDKRGGRNQRPPLHLAIRCIFLWSYYSRIASPVLFLHLVCVSSVHNKNDCNPVMFFVPYPLL